MKKNLIMDYWMKFNLIGVLGICHSISGLSVTHIDVPEIVDFRDRSTLSCSYHMGGYKLNSVKWYKDNNEFFRYSPMTHPIFMTFSVDGVILTNDYYCNENTCSITLDQLRYKSSGSYRCEVSGDAPEFKLTTRTSNMTVAALPQYDPNINGVSYSYHIDEYVTANCSSDWSSPPAILSWYINGEKASSEMLEPQQETSTHIGEFTLKLRSLEIRFYLSYHIYRASEGVLELKCVAEINQMPKLRREKTISSPVLFQDDLRNQKLINSVPGKKMPSKSSLLLTSGMIYCFYSKWLLCYSNFHKDSLR